MFFVYLKQSVNDRDDKFILRFYLKGVWYWNVNDTIRSGIKQILKLSNYIIYKLLTKIVHVYMYIVHIVVVVHIQCSTIIFNCTVIPISFSSLGNQQNMCFHINICSIFIVYLVFHQLIRATSWYTLYILKALLERWTRNILENSNRITW